MTAITAAIAEAEPEADRLSFTQRPMTPALARLFTRAELPFKQEVSSGNTRTSTKRAKRGREGNDVRL